MGSGTYSNVGHDNYVRVNRVKERSMHENFSQRGLHPDVDPRNFNKDVRKYVLEPGFIKVCGVRQSCLSKEHPNVTDVYVFCDGTGSMGRIPQDILQNQFPGLMNALYEAGVPDPEIGFGMIGDHKSDDVPIQFTQIEPNSEKLLPQMQKLYIEQGGGGNGGESYLLAWWLALYHIEAEAFYEKNKKPFIFTIGDEPCHGSLSGWALKSIFGYKGNVPDITAKKLLELALEKYHVFHIHVTDGAYRERPIESWKKLIDEDRLIVCDSEEVCQRIAQTVISVLKKEDNLVQDTPTQDIPAEIITETNSVINDDSAETDPLGDVLGF